MHAVADYSYFWDYPALFVKIGAGIVHDQAYPLSNQGLGPFYHLYVVKPIQRQDARDSKPSPHRVTVERPNKRKRIPQVDIRKNRGHKEKDANFYNELFLAGGWQK